MPLYHVRVTTGTKNDSIHVDGERIMVTVRSAAERNQANIAVLRIVKQHFKATRIELISGHHKSHKIVRID